jgi:hypothetical protein
LVGDDNFFGTAVLEVTVLGFYSSCTGKPHRFQFIYLDKLQGSSVSQLNVYKDDNRTIAEKNC